MIRINLLAVDRERTKRTGALIPAAHRVTIAASLIVIATFLGVAWWFWSLRQTSSRLDADIAKGEVETQQLRRGQNGPVHLLDEISKSLPDRLWLTEMTQKGDDFVISGMTTSLTGLSDFVGNLESSNWFKKPVDIVDSQVTTDPKNGDIFKFSIKAVFNNPEAPPPPPPPTGARGRGAPPVKK
ncbi:MAG TPA: PilN domain-containing protein [Vicinamibacterales bacterium]|nr:PilN domain-containing protein [Vicinamibacterales bacterium]